MPRLCFPFSRDTVGLCDLVERVANPIARLFVPEPIGTGRREIVEMGIDCMEAGEQFLCRRHSDRLPEHVQTQPWATCREGPVLTIHCPAAESIQQTDVVSQRRGRWPRSLDRNRDVRRVRDGQD